MAPDVDNLTDQKVDAAIAEYLEAVKNGSAPDPEAFIARHAEIAGELKEFLNDYDVFGGAAREFAAGVSTDGKAHSTGRTSSAPRLPLAGPQRFGNFELLEETARGGMGVVYKARQSTPTRTVALKMILAGQFASPADIDRFYTEAHAAAALDHPNIVPIFEVGEHEGQHYFTMAFVKGQSLAQRLLGSPLPAKEAAMIIRDVAQAIEYAHQHGVIHRDLKPANILVDNNGRVRVTDFGLAKRQTDDGGLTRTGELLGTPSFMSPEQVSGDPAKIGRAADVYSLGATLYALLTGRPPFQAASTVDTLRQVMDQDPVPPRQLDASVPRDLETITLKCLAKDDSKRYLGANALAEDLERFLADRPILARRATRTERAVRWCRRKPVVAALSAAVVALTIAAITILATSNAQIRTQAARSEQVAKFLSDTLSAAGPSVARGRDATLLREIMDKTAARLNSEVQDQPEVRGDLFYTLGRTFHQIGDWPRAVEMFQHAVESYRSAPGEETTKFALALGQLGSSQSYAANVKEGSANSAKALEIARRCGDPDALATCLVLAGSSLNSWGLGTQDALPLLREAVELRKRMGADPMLIADSMSVLARCMETPGPYAEESLALHREVLDLRLKHLPAEDSKVTNAYFGLGQTLLWRGEFAEAEAALGETFERYQKYYSPLHPFHPTVLRFLAAAMMTQGKNEEAEAVVRQAAERAPDALLFWELLGRIKSYNGDNESAVELFSKAKNDAFLAVALVQSKRYHEYAELYRHYLRRGANRKQPAFNRYVAKFFLLLPFHEADLADVRRYADKAETDESGFMEARVRVNKALADYRVGRYESANDWARQAISDQARLPNVAQAWYIQALARTAMGDHESARNCLREADELLNEPDRNTRGDFLEDWAEWDVAEILRQEAVTSINATARAQPGSLTAAQGKLADAESLYR
jgi:serine/threonine protein kinase/Tfp pilus assembly protein PilF